MNNSPDRVLTEKGESLPGCGAGSGRIKFVDTAKGICILLVVMYHAGLVDNDTPCLSMLRMPFYFTLSGLFFIDKFCLAFSLVRSFFAQPFPYRKYRVDHSLYFFVLYQAVAAA